MSCKITRFDICRLIQESFVSPTFDFGDVDISNDTFVYTVKKYLTEKRQIIDVVKLDNNKIAIAEHDLKIGKYEHELLWIHGTNKDVVIQGIVEVTDKGNCKRSCSNQSNIIQVVTENTIINVTYSENIINVGGGGNWGYIQGDIQNQTDLVEFIDEKIGEVEVDLSNYDTKAEVDTKINDAKDWVENQDFITSSELPTVGNGTITITQGGVSKGTFTTNQSGNTTIEVDKGNADVADVREALSYFLSTGEDTEEVVDVNTGKTSTLYRMNGTTFTSPYNSSKLIDVTNVNEINYNGLRWRTAASSSAENDGLGTLIGVSSSGTLTKLVSSLITDVGNVNIDENIDVTNYVTLIYQTGNDQPKATITLYIQGESVAELDSVKKYIDNKVVNSQQIFNTSLNDYYVNAELDITGGCVSFIDDDMPNLALTQLASIFSAKNAPFGIAVVGNNVNDSNKDLIKSLAQNGVEFLNHTMTHPTMTTLTKAQQYEEIKQCDDVLTELGVNTKLYVSTFGYFNQDTVDNLANLGYYCNFRFDEAIPASLANEYKTNSITNMYNFGIQRVNYGSAFGDQQTPAQMKVIMDYAKANNRWLVICTHIGNSQLPNWEAGLNEIIDYARTINIPIVSPFEGFKRFRNLREFKNKRTNHNGDELTGALTFTP